MTDIDNLATDLLVAASVARTEGHLETSDAFLTMARYLQPLNRTHQNDRVASASDFTELNTSG